MPRIFNTLTDRLDDSSSSSTASIYVCGITPYDATHVGHAATYIAFDTLIRSWLDAGIEVLYVQNTTDVDDPLLERAAATGMNWRDLADEQTDVFREDMEFLRVIPPTNFVAVTEAIEPVAQAVTALLERDIAYRVDDDVYFDSRAAADAGPWSLGDESHFDRESMLALSSERGGDPDRPGKRDALDPLLWRAAREGEPAWDSVLGAGRPGWHIECSVIAGSLLELPITVNGGGRDLIFPHHEFSAGHAAALTGTPLAQVYSHAGLVSYRGEKMSKSLGNLVFVRALADSGVNSRAIRLVILGQRYRDDWEWTDSLLDEATERLGQWVTWADSARDDSTPDFANALRGLISKDLDTPAAIRFVDDGIARGVSATTGATDAIDALLGIRL